MKGESQIDWLILISKLRDKPVRRPKCHIFCVENLNCSPKKHVVRCESRQNRVTFGAALQLGSSFAGLQIPYARTYRGSGCVVQMERLSHLPRNKRVVVICDEQQLLAVANNEIIGDAVPCKSRMWFSARRRPHSRVLYRRSSYIMAGRGDHLPSTWALLRVSCYTRLLLLLPSESSAAEDRSAPIREPNSESDQLLIAASISPSAAHSCVCARVSECQGARSAKYWKIIQSRAKLLDCEKWPPRPPGCGPKLECDLFFNASNAAMLDIEEI